MLFGIIFFVLLALAVIYYIYRQFTDPGLSLFPNNEPRDAQKQCKTENNI